MSRECNLSCSHEARLLRWLAGTGGISTNGCFVTVWRVRNSFTSSVDSEIIDTELIDGLFFVSIYHYNEQPRRISSNSMIVSLRIPFGILSCAIQAAGRLSLGYRATRSTRKLDSSTSTTCRAAGTHGRRSSRARGMKRANISVHVAHEFGQTPFSCTLRGPPNNGERSNGFGFSVSLYVCAEKNRLNSIDRPTCKLCCAPLHVRHGPN